MKVKKREAKLMTISDLDKLGRRCPKCGDRLGGSRILVCNNCDYKETQFGLGKWG